MDRSSFMRYQLNHCCHVKNFDKSFVILLLYVDYMLIAGPDMQEIYNLKEEIVKVVCNERSRRCGADSWNEDHQR